MKHHLQSLILELIASDRKVLVSAETETKYSTECSAIYGYLVSAEYSVQFAYRNRNYTVII
jgi:hypothetical protein